jgi:Domain of unknown function (DUF4157)
MASATPGATHGKAVASQGTRAPAPATHPPAEPFLIQLQAAAGNRAASVLLTSADTDLVERAVLSPGLALAPAVRSVVESRLGRLPRPVTGLRPGPGLSVVMPWHPTEREADTDLTLTASGASKPPVDLSQVRIHTGDLAERSARALRAKAFAVGNHIVFGPGQYSPATDRGQALLAHEIMHTFQQATGQRAVMRSPDEQAAVADPKLAQGASPSAVGFKKFTKTEHSLSSRVVNLSHGFRHLASIVYPLLVSAGIFSHRRLDYELYWHGVLGVYALEDQIETDDSYDPIRLSQWIQTLQGGLSDIHKLLAVLKESGDKKSAIVDFWDGQTTDLEAQAKALAGDKYIVGGFEARQKESQEADLNRRMDEATDYIRDRVEFVARSPNRDQMTRWYGQIFAEQFVYKWHFKGDQIRALFERFRSEGHLNDVLMGGSTVHALLSIGIGGFWEYRAQGEGLFAGAARTELENKISHPIQDRPITGWENLEAAAGFVAGVFQGIGDDLIDNVKALIDLFTPSFWKQIWKFLTEELPHLAADEEYRFQVGSILGRTELDEQRRAAASDPFEYGRTIGHAGGVVLTEIVMLFIGIGWVLKASKASPTIMKIVKPVMKVVNAIAKTAAGNKVAEFAAWAAEGLAAIERRVQAVLLKIPRLTEAGRAERAIKEVELATERLKGLQLAAQRAASAGDEEKVAKYIEEFDNASKELDSKLASLEQKGRGEAPQTGKADPDLEKRADVSPATAKKEIVRPAGEPGHTVKITPSGQLMRCSDVCATLWLHYGEMLDKRADLRKKLVDLEQEIAKAYLQGNEAALDRLAVEAEQFEHDLFLGKDTHEHVTGTDPVVGSAPPRGGDLKSGKPYERPPKTGAEVKVEARDAAARLEKGLNDLKIKELQDYVRVSEKEIARGTKLRDLAANSPEMLEDLWLEHLERLKNEDFKTRDYADYVRKRMPEFRGRVGEFATAFERGPDEIMVFAPKARTTEPGLDLITYTTDKRIEILDNKAFSEGARVGKVSAFEKNLPQNMEAVIEDLEKYAASPGSPPELAAEVLPRMRAAQKEVEQEVLSVLAKNPKADLYAKDVQKEITGILDKYGIDRRVTLGGSGPNVKVTDRLLDRISKP